MKRIVVVLSSVMALIALSVTLGGAAWSATVPSSTPSSTPIIIFDDVGQQAQLIIPTPACPDTQPDCTWKFFLNLPKLHIDVATVYGTSGTLSIPYPPNFCGVIQADAYVGPPWVAKRGFQHTINNCEPPPTTTTTTKPITPVIPPTTTTTTGPPPPTTGPPTPPTNPPPASHVTPPVVAVPTAAPVAATTATPAATPAPAPTQLPFTGVDTKPLLAIGLLLVMLGLLLLNSAESWRRGARRLLATVQSR